MTIFFMRFIDDVLGMFICRVLGQMVMIKGFFLPSKRTIDPQKVKTILCQKYFGMGSVLHTTSLIKGLRQHYPNARIIFITLKSHSDIVRICKLADEVLVLQVDSLGKFIKGMLVNLVYIMRQRVDISIDLEFFSKFTMIISLLSMAKIRLGLHQKRIRPEGIITHNIYYNHYKHISDIFFAFATCLEIERKPEYFTSLLPSLKDMHKESLEKNLGIKQDMPIIVIDVNASELFKFRKWPADSFVELIQLLIDKYPDYYYVMIGGNSECEYVENVAKKIKYSGHQLINCAGMTSIEELLALIEMSYLIITNDSGPLHIAALYGTRIVAFFGPETPLVYGPQKDNTLTFYSKDLYCSPCLSVYDNKKSLYGEECIGQECLTSIKPDEVFRKIEYRFLVNKPSCGV
jgi:ADP-heptose:LPS heptosyltransferase